MLEPLPRGPAGLLGLHRLDPILPRLGGEPQKLQGPMFSSVHAGQGCIPAPAPAWAHSRGWGGGDNVAGGGGCSSWSRESWGASFCAGEQLLPLHLRTDTEPTGWLSGTEQVSSPTRCHKAEAGVAAAEQERGWGLCSLKGRGSGGFRGM